MDSTSKIIALIKAVGGSGGGGGGSGGGILKVGVTPETGALDKTWKQIYDALNAGYYVTLVFPTEDEGGIYQDSIYSAEMVMNDRYGVFSYSLHDNSTSQFIADSENGYPVFSS